MVTVSYFYKFYTGLLENILIFRSFLGFVFKIPLYSREENEKSIDIEQAVFEF